MMKRALVFAALAASALGSASLGQAPGRARPDAIAAVDGLFSSAQAARGAQLFAANCARCHNAPQAAQFLLSQGAGQSLGDYHARLSLVMPPEGASRPSEAEFLAIIAHLMSTAGARPGDADAELDDASWREARIPEGVTIDPTASVTSVAEAVEWPYYRGDALGRGYSTASLIDADNVGELTVAWRWSGANYGPSAEVRNITTPLMVEGVLYATAGTTRNVVALDAATGQTLWMWRPQEDPARFANAPRKGAGRGVAYWTDGAEARIFTTTPGFHLAALDAATGRPVEGFGDGGQVDLMEGLRNAPADRLADIGGQSPPLVIGDIVVVGPAHLVSVRPRSRSNVKGDVRGFDARTGKLVWTFHTIPEPREPGYETWENGSAAYTGNAGVWAPMSADLETGMIYLPVEAATSDLYGGERHGDNLFSSSLVCLDGRTGELQWARQLIHHDVFDWDPPTSPILADIPQADGSTLRAVAQLTKQAFVYVFNRDTGEPVWPIEERPVPASDVPGEAMSPTQPFPTLPAPYDRQGVSGDDLIDFTPQLHAEALEAVQGFRLGPIFSPPSLADAADGTHGTLMLPNPGGGANWEGGAFDPETGMLYVGSSTNVYVSALQKSPEGSDIAYMAAGGRTPNVRGLPLTKPPYGRVTAIDLTTGQHAWMRPNADTPEEIANNPALAGLDIPPTGVATRAGLLITPTLLFQGEGENGGSWLHARDKATGEDIAKVALPMHQTGLPMTYVWGGRQYVVMAIGDGADPAEIVALTTPH